MFADFEYKLHTMAENEALSSKVITDLYAKLNQEYYGDDVVMDELLDGHVIMFLISITIIMFINIL